MKRILFKSGSVFLRSSTFTLASILIAALGSAEAQEAYLPGPEGGDGYFGIRVVRDNGFLGDISDAENSLASGLGNITDALVSWINHSDPDSPGSGGIIGSDSPFPGDRPGNENDFAWLAKGNILIRKPGLYTFGFDGDDGHALWLEGATFTVNGGTGSVPQDTPDMFWFPVPTARAYTTASTFLAPGVHELRYLGWERNGGAFGEVFSATGGVNFAQWLLIGDSSILPEVSPVVMLKWPAEVVNAPTPMNRSIDGAKKLINKALLSGETVTGETDILVLTDGDGICCGRPGVIMEQRAVTFPISDAGQENGFSTGIFGELIVDDGDDISGETLLLTILIASDDGSQFHVIGHDFIGKGSNGSLKLVDGDWALTADFQSGNTNTYGTIELVEGVYPFEGWHFEVDGDAGWEIWTTTGDYRDDFTAGNFAPVSNVLDPVIFPGNQGLSLVSRATKVEVEVDPENNEHAVGSYNIKSRKHLKVAVFSTLDFDATKFSEGLFTLSDPDLVNQGFAQTHSALVQDNNRDGLLDIVIDFGPAREVAAKGAINAGSLKVNVVGIANNSCFEGTDEIKVVGK